MHVLNLLLEIPRGNSKSSKMMETLSMLYVVALLLDCKHIFSIYKLQTHSSGLAADV